MSDRSDLPRFLVEAGVLRFGEFTLKSGKRSPYFLNFGEVRSGRTLARLGGFYADLLQQRLQSRFSILYGPPYKGIPLGVATCQALWTEHRVDCGFLSYRKEGKAHGEGGDLLGTIPGPGDRIVMIDDVMTTGGAKLEAMDRVRHLGPVYTAVVVAVDRDERESRGRTPAENFERETGVPVLPLIGIRELVEALRRDGLIAAEHYDRVQRHLTAPGEDA
ncbi:MAG: orotate phosphoribosyltransferase [Armatimonadetes bacterium]|nr:orotate phosphoribosyltransferase [Armatimonadota bacterium]